MKLVLGSGHKKKNDYVNIDYVSLHSPEIVRDLRRGIPFADNACEEVHSENFLEHVDPDDCVFIMQEIQRVLNIAGKADIIVPLGVVPDISHKTFFHKHSFDNLISQKDVYNLGKLRLVSKEFKTWPEPYDYVEMHLVLEKTEKWRK